MWIFNFSICQNQLLKTSTSLLDVIWKFIKWFFTYWSPEFDLRSVSLLKVIISEGYMLILFCFFLQHRRNTIHNSKHKHGHSYRNWHWNRHKSYSIWHKPFLNRNWYHWQFEWWNDYFGKHQVIVTSCANLLVSGHFQAVAYSAVELWEGKKKKKNRRGVRFCGWDFATAWWGRYS